MSIKRFAVVTVVLVVLLDERATLNIDSLPIVDPDQLDALVPNLDSENSDGDLNFTQLAAKYGHPAEEYVTYTEDGYRLKVFRLPGGKFSLPILLFHGFSDSCDTWIIRGEISLAIYLANAGYDVWLGNVRGNKYSQETSPITLDSNATYWNFTFHEYGVYDVPTTIDLILTETSASQVNAIVHSQGSTIFFVLLSTKPEYNEKVNLLITLAPVAYLHHSPPPLGILLRSIPKLYDALKASHQYAIFSDNSPTLALVRKTCAATAAASYLICLQGLVYQYTGYDVTQVDPAFSLVAFKHAPTATSTKDALHYSQVTIRRSFSQFDYGADGNLVAYGSVEPPPYKLENVKSKVVLLTAKNDFFSTQADVAILRRRLPNVVRFVVNPRVEMNHLDYVWGENMTNYLFPYIFESLETYGQT